MCVRLQGLNNFSDTRLEKRPTQLGAFVGFVFQVQQVITGQTHNVDDGMLSASSSKDGNNGPPRSRLHTLPDGELGGSWVAGNEDPTPWIGVDLQQSITVRGVSSQGRPEDPQWVKNFTIQYEHHGQWHDYINTVDRNNNKTTPVNRKNINSLVMKKYTYSKILNVYRVCIGQPTNRTRLEQTTSNLESCRVSSVCFLLAGREQQHCAGICKAALERARTRTSVAMPTSWRTETCLTRTSKTKMAA